MGLAQGLLEAPKLALDNIIFITAGVLVVAAIYSWRSYAKLRHIPGPLSAAATNFTRLSWVFGRKAQHKHIALHRKYGPLVRFGPNMVSIGDPAEIPKIYGFKGTYIKSDFYPVLQPYVRGTQMPGIFNTPNEDLHRVLKKPISNIYSMSNLVSFEPYVDSTIETFFAELDKRYAATGAICELDVWLQRFAFDVIGEITFSKRLGFLEGAQDVDGIMASIWHHFEQASVVGQMPWIDNLWNKNPIRQFVFPPPMNPIVKFAKDRMDERQAVGDDIEKNNRDFLSRFLQAKAKDTQAPNWALMAWTTSNVLAGSDTTAILLRSVFYHLLKNPKTLQKLLAELQTAASNGRLSEPVSWTVAHSDLPYLDACIKEAGRIHPPFGLPLERIVPKEGAEFCGQRLPGGTIVGINGWVAHRDPNVFGEDVDDWRPERWFPDDDEHRKLMERSLLTFGQGHRSCIGKNISYLEIYKLVPSVLRRFEIELADPSQEWHVENRWFVVQTGLNVRLRKRDIEKRSLE